jgi:integrase
MEKSRKPPTIGEALNRWYEDYEQTFSPSFAEAAKMNIDRHLIPFFGELRLTELEERHLLQFIREKTGEGATPRPLRASTVLNILSVLRRVLALAVENGELDRNPCRNLGRLLGKVKRQQSEEVSRVDSWSREEIARLLGVAEKGEPRFYPFLALLLHTGCRKGEARALKWTDVDWHASRILVRRSISRDKLTPPKSGKARSVVLSPALAEILRDLLAQRRRECLKRGWGEVPEWVFCSEAGGLLDGRNLTRTWHRVRRKAQAQGVRPLRLHDARHHADSWIMPRLSAEVPLRVDSPQLIGVR